MIATAKIFTTGNSQAVRLPKAFRVNASEVWIARNEASGEITLKPINHDQRRRNLQLLLKMIEEDPLTEDFIPERSIELSRNPLEEWAEPAPAKSAKAAQSKRAAP